MTLRDVEVINLTREPLELVDGAGRPITIPPDPRHLGIVSIGEHRAVRIAPDRALPLNVQFVSEVKGLPDPSGNTIFVVPVEIAMALQQRREDVYFLSEDAVGTGTTGSHPVRRLRRIVSQIDS